MINRAILVGRLTKDPELRRTSNDIPVTTFTVAVNRTFKNQQGEQEADFINCVVWRRQAENVAQYLNKGSLVGVEGRIQTRNYEDNEGVRKFIVEIVADSVQFLEPKGTTPPSNNQQNNQQKDQKSSNYNETKKPSNDDDLKDIDIADDDLPF